MLTHAVSTKVVKWEADEAFVPAKDTDFASNTTLATWNTLMPQGTGWRHTETETTFFTTTMTHQLHCIVRTPTPSRQRVSKPEAERQVILSLTKSLKNMIERAHTLFSLLCRHMD